MYKLFVFHIVLTIVMVEGYKYVAIPENDNLFDECTGYENRGIDKILDLSNFSITANGDSYHCEGMFKFLIDDFEPTDIVELRGTPQVYRFGRWSPTTFNMVRHDLWKTLFDPREMWYSVWFKHVYEEDRHNLQKGCEMRVHPFDAQGLLHVPGPDCSGRYKVSFSLIPYTQKGVKKAHLAYCFAMFFEISRHYD